MAKKTQTNIVEVWNWLIRNIETGDFNATEQIVLVHLIAAINRNLWKPTKYNTKIISALIGKDIRTVNKAIDSLISKGVITQTEEGFYIGIEQQRNSVQQYNEQQPANFTGIDGKGNSNVTELKPADKQRKFF